MSERKPFLDLILEYADYDQGNLDRVALKAVHPDFTSRNGFRWAFPGYWTRDPDDTGDYTGDVCPQRKGDGLSLAKTTLGMAQGGYSPVTVLVVGFDDRHVLAEDDDKLKVVEAKSLAVVDGIKVIREHGAGANLRGARLVGAYLDGANLDGANLDRANLRGANLRWANLDGVNLTRAYGRDDWDDLVKRGAIR